MLHTGLLAGLCKDGRMSTTITTARTRVFALFLVIFGALGLLAAFALSNKKNALPKNPTAPLGCNIGVLVKCSTNLDSWQGSVFGFANSFIGLMAWPVVITIGVALLGGVHFPRWFWAGLNVGALGALVFVGWLIYQSIFSLDVLRHDPHVLDGDAAQSSGWHHRRPQSGETGGNTALWLGAAHHAGLLRHRHPHRTASDERDPATFVGSAECVGTVARLRDALTSWWVTRTRVRVRARPTRVSLNRVRGSAAP